MENCCRTADDVLATLSLSKLDANELAKPSQTLYFSLDASDQEYTLVQLNKEIMAEVQKGEDLVIRGNDGDPAVLCTKDRTYDIKMAKISNSLLLVPECAISAKKKSSTASESDDEKENIDAADFLLHRKIVGWSHGYLELKRMHPQIDRIRKLLNENPYQGPEKESENSNKRKYTLTELLSVIQASEGELVDALFKIGSCCIDGFWRVLDFGYVVECLGEICNVIDSESWNIFKVPLRQLCEKINDSGELVPNFIVCHLMGFYGNVARDGDQDDTYYKLNEEKLCQFFAEMLLRDVGKFNLSEFLEVWEQSVPDGLKPDQKHLRGLAIIDKSSKPATIQHFTVDSLPQDISARFDTLFQTRPKWTRQEIEPYIEDLCLDGQSVSALLTKYARSSMQNSTKVFCSRKTTR